MNLLLLLGALVLTACLIGSKLSHLLRIPTLFFFIALGMLFGSDGLLKIEFSDYALSEQLCSAALIFMVDLEPSGIQPVQSLSNPSCSVPLVFSSLPD